MDWRILVFYPEPEAVMLECEIHIIDCEVKSL
jgi:hypothetical protein